MKHFFGGRRAAADRLVIGNRVPRDFFVAKGRGESDITVHAGSYHLALKQAEIESYNIMTYSSILPGIAREVEHPGQYTHGAVLESIMAVANPVQGERGTAGIIFGWLFDKTTGAKYGGIVCECNGAMTEKAAEKQLRASLDELYTNGYSDQWELKDIKLTINSFVPKKKYGTVMVALCFVNYVYPVINQ